MCLAPAGLTSPPWRADCVTLHLETERASRPQPRGPPITPRSNDSYETPASRFGRYGRTERERTFLDGGLLRSRDALRSADSRLGPAHGAPPPRRLVAPAWLRIVALAAVLSCL